jgi:hypothetical protein
MPIRGEEAHDRAAVVGDVGAKAVGVLQRVDVGFTSIGNGAERGFHRGGGEMK